VIIYNSHTSARQHEALGYLPGKRAIIPNGFDCKLFRPDADARSKVRKELGIAEQNVLIGLIARDHPMKDHIGFLRAAGQVLRSCPEARFLLAGAGVNDHNLALGKAIAEEGLKGTVFLLGERSDTERLNAALDIACSASAWGEGFSNSIGEAMACGVPCVVTDIGDSALLVGGTGCAVAARDPGALAAAILDLATAGGERRRHLGERARSRIQEEFSLPSIVQRYEGLYREHIPLVTT
jgi:glycosyltransferase involved in cell wall biosynthesis